MTEETPPVTETADQPEQPAGLSALDPAKVDATLAELVEFDHKLRDHNMSLCDVLTDLVQRSMGIRLDPPPAPEA